MMAPHTPHTHTATLVIPTYRRRPLGVQPTITKIQVPIAGTIAVPLSNGSFETVSLTGKIHIKTQVTIPNSPPTNPPTNADLANPVRIHIDLDQVLGWGDITGLHYVVTGSNKLNYPSYPNHPMDLGFNLVTVTVPENTRILPTTHTHPLDISFILTFNQDTGSLSSVTIESMTVPVD